MEFALRYGKIDWTFTASEKGVYRKIRSGRVKDVNARDAQNHAPLVEVGIRGRMSVAHVGGRHMICSETENSGMYRTN